MRKFRRPSNGRHFDDELQWGRTLSSAEVISNNTGKITCGSASMGPHSFKCGSPANFFRLFSLTCLLQWGRTLSSAEVDYVGRRKENFRKASMGPHSFKCGSFPSICVIWPFTSGFNGAALFQVRKFPPKPKNPIKRHWLQWGRTLSSAEVSSVPSGALFHVGLQWGRTLSSAEVGFAGR